MALKIALAAKNSFALYCARDEFICENIEDVVRTYGSQDNVRMIELRDSARLYLISESAWRRGAYARGSFDQIFIVGPEPLGIDFMLELQKCLKGSCVPEEWKWQKWVSQNLRVFAAGSGNGGADE